LKEYQAMKKYLPLTIALALSAPVLAFAQEGGAQMMAQEHFEQLDTDKSGSVSRAEYQTFMEGAFTKIDKDGNGVLTQTEAITVLTPEQISSVDTNKDGQISREEFMTQVMSDFSRHDRNGDGQLQHP